MISKWKTTIFPKMRGKFKFFECTISKQENDGKYINASMEVKFGNAKKYGKEFIDSLEVGKFYHLEVNDGFLSADTWEDKLTHETRKKVVIVITDATMGKCGEVANKDK